MLNSQQIVEYRSNGYIVLEDVFTEAEVTAARAVVEEFVERSRTVLDHDSVYDLEPWHSAENPKVRRLKEPCGLHPIFRELGWSERVLDVVGQLIGNGIRHQTSKLNMKSPEFGSPVEWHQDFAFYPHTNDDLCAIGIALDTATLENGCMLMLPGSHLDEIYDHHQNGVFVGAIDVQKESIDVRRAIPVPVRAGGITIHHCRMLHASAPNTSAFPRRVFFLEMCASDAFPVLGVPDYEAFNARLLRGEPMTSYRSKSMDVRIPLPWPEKKGSIYEMQTHFAAKSFLPR